AGIRKSPARRKAKEESQQPAAKDEQEPDQRDRPGEICQQRGLRQLFLPLREPRDANNSEDTTIAVSNCGSRPRVGVALNA
ncbi:MAG: hypothetical protein DMG23_14480, partial [Acidobacteria bacterium]